MGEHFTIRLHLKISSGTLPQDPTQNWQTATPLLQLANSLHLLRNGGGGGNMPPQVWLSFPHHSTLYPSLSLCGVCIFHIAMSSPTAGNCVLDTGCLHRGYRKWVGSWSWCRPSSEFPASTTIKGSATAKHMWKYSYTRQWERQNTISLMNKDMLPIAPPLPHSSPFFLNLLDLCRFAVCSGGGMEHSWLLPCTLLELEPSFTPHYPGVVRTSFKRSSPVATPHVSF